MAVVEAVQQWLLSASQVAPCYFQSPESENAMPSQGEGTKGKITSKGFYFFFNFKLVFNFFFHFICIQCMVATFLLLASSHTCWPLYLSLPKKPHPTFMSLGWVCICLCCASGNSPCVHESHRKAIS